MTSWLQNWGLLSGNTESSLFINLAGGSAASAMDGVALCMHSEVCTMLQMRYL